MPAYATQSAPKQAQGNPQQQKAVAAKNDAETAAKAAEAGSA